MHMSYRNIAIITAVVLFSLVFPSAQIRHSFSDWDGAPAAPTLPTPTVNPACVATNNAPVDNTQCGNMLQDMVDTIIQNVRSNLALVGFIDVQKDVPTRVADALPAPGVLQPPVTTVASVTAISMVTQTVPPSATKPRSIPTQTPTLQRFQTITVSATTARAPQIIQVTTPAETAITATNISETATTIPATDTPAPATATAVVLLPQSILDGFRSRMPVAGYWENNKDGVYVAVGSFKYLRTFYSSEAPDTKRFVVCSILIANTRSSGGLDVYVDRTNITLTDIDGKQTTAVVASDDLDQALQASRVAPGQRVGGQIAFLVDRYAAPGQITISSANMDEYLSRTTQTIELRVWPIVP